MWQAFLEAEYEYSVLYNMMLDNTLLVTTLINFTVHSSLVNFTVTSSQVSIASGDSSAATSQQAINPRRCSVLGLGDIVPDNARALAKFYTSSE